MFFSISLSVSAAASWPSVVFLIIYLTLLHILSVSHTPCRSLPGVRSLHHFTGSHKQVSVNPLHSDYQTIWFFFLIHLMFWSLFYWSVVDSQRHVNFCCPRAEWQHCSSEDGPGDCHPKGSGSGTSRTCLLRCRPALPTLLGDYTPPTLSVLTCWIHFVLVHPLGGVHRADWIATHISIWCLL